MARWPRPLVPLTRPPLLILLWIIQAVPVFSQHILVPADPLRHEDRFVGDDRTFLFILSHGYLIPGTLSVFADDSAAVSDSLYGLELLEGRIRFFVPPDSGQSFRIVYRAWPLRIPLLVRRRTAGDSLQTSPSVSPEAATVPARGDSSGPAEIESLKRSGSIFRGVTVGTDQGMRLVSGLRLQVSGRITKDVEVVASLTDQNTPIQPEGNTQTLQEIDKVFITIKAPRMSATLGDCVFDVSGLDFGSFSRKIQGVLGTIQTGPGSLTISAAATKGRSTTNRFQGQEGIQGPYQLAGPEGQREIIVLAGSERVWIDGQAMVRGEDNDYTIEYGNGQILFTRNRLITGDSRITVDFEYSDQQYPKTVVGGTGEVRLLDDRFRLRTSFLRESDDKDQPLDRTLTEEERAILARAGDRPDSAVVSGVDSVGSGLGAYERVDSSGTVFYRYVGSGSGNYLVRFSYMGSGQGDYEFRGYGNYVWVGPGLGDYLPVVFLSLAQSRQILDMSSSLQIHRGVFLEGEFGVSDRDLNLFSSTDDNDNVDVAAQGRIRVDPQRLHFFGKDLASLAFGGQFRKVGDKFRSMDRMGEVEHGRKWGVDEGETWGEDILELRASLKTAEFVSIDGEWGTFQKGEAVSSTRSRMALAVLPKTGPRFKYQMEWIQTDEETRGQGKWLRQSADLGVSWKGFRPSIVYTGEFRKTSNPDSAFDTGFRFDECSGGLVLETRSFRGEIAQIVRDDRVFDQGSLESLSLAQTTRFRAEYRKSSAWSASGMLTWRNRDYKDPSLEDQKANLADMKFLCSPGRGAFNGSLNYQFSSNRVSEMVRDTVRVGEGLGNYRFDEELEELVPDPDGDIVFRTIQTGQFLPVNDIKLGVDVRMVGSRIWKNKRGWKGLLGFLQIRTLLRGERRDKAQDFLDANARLFQPRWGSDSTTVLGLASFQQDVEFERTGISARLRFRKDDSENRQLVEEGYVRQFDETSGRVKMNPARQWGLMAEVTRRNESRAYFSRSSSDRDIQSLGLVLESSFRPRQSIELALQCRVEGAEDRAPNPETRALFLVLQPRFVYSFTGRGQLRMDFESGEVRSNASDRSLPYEMFGGYQIGRSRHWSLLLIYRLSGHVMATVNYRGKDDPWREKVIHSGQVEVRAFF